MTQFLGGSPLSVLIRLVIISLLVGLILSWLHLTPAAIVDWIVDFFRWLSRVVFGSLDNVLSYFLLGAVIVVPIFLLSRLLKLGR
nr:DUF6460 domain-containing protein [Aurantimonas sp. CSK15Z-1]